LLNWWKTCYVLTSTALRNLIGVSLSQLLASVDAFYDSPGKQTRGAPGLGASPANEGNPKIDRNFKSEVWKSLTAHPDILVGEDKRGNDLDLGEIEALLPIAVEGPSLREASSSPAKDLDPSRHRGQEPLEEDLDDPSSPSAQLLEQLQPPAAKTLPANGDLTSSVHDDAEDALAGDSQRKSHSSEPVSHTNNGLESDKIVDTAVVHAQQISKTTESMGRESEGHERLSLTSQALTTQPRIYVSHERMRKAITGDGIRYRETPKLEPLANPPRRRGRPPKVKTLDPPRRRGRPPKARAPTATLNTSPPMPQQIPSNESPGSENVVLPESTPEPKKRHGRQTRKVTIFTSHDESQRDAGMPGVYFDLAEFEKTGAGRPKKRKIALFKSEKLKSLPWMKGEIRDIETSTPMNRPVNPLEAAVIGDSTKNLIQENGTIKRKRSHESELEATSDEPQPKKLLLDMVRDFGRFRPAPYKSPYRSSTRTSYVSPYSADAPTATPSTTQDGSLHRTLAVVPSQIQTLSLSAITKAPALVSEYISPYAPMQLTSSKPPDQSSTSNPSSEQPLVIEASQSIRDKQLEAAINFAGEMVIPDVTIRLPSSKDGIAGNLCLSRDKKCLTFVTGETQTERTPITIQISDIVESPQTSAIGSETMVLRITTSSTYGTEETHHFRFLPTEAAFSAANNMRAKIVTAMMLLDLEDSNDIVEPEKPFKCSGCDGAWKNWEGLKYHQTKSKTLCNPNYTPRINRQTNSNTEVPSESKESAPQSGQDILEIAAAALDALNGEVVAQPKNRSFPEGSFDDIAPATAVEQQPAKRSKPTVAGTKSKDARSDPELQRGKDIIMALLDANGKVFPGEKSLWFAYVAASLQKFPDSGLSNYDVCSMALDLLEDIGQVRKVQFSFKDKTGLMKMRTLIARNDVDPTSTAVIAMKENIKTAFPEYYVPPGFAPPKVVQSMLEERQNRPEVAESAPTSHKAALIPQDHNLVVEQEPEALHTPFNYTAPSKITRSGRISRRPQRLMQSNLEPSLRNPEEAMNEEDDDSYAEDFSSNDQISRAPHFAAGGRRKRRRPKALKTGLEGSNPTNGTKSLHKGDLTPPPQTMDDEPQQETDSDRPQRKRKKHEIRPAEATPDRNAMWQPALTYLQGKNGAWNTQTPPRLTRKYAPRAGLPEPITYMQTLDDPTWSFRPYGHGVRPIHARPAKRAEGQTAYLTRIQYGFRPVMMPNGEIYIPSTPSKNMIDQALETATEGVPHSAGPTRQKRKYTRRSSNVSKTREITTEGVPQSAGSTATKRKYSRRPLNISKAQVKTPPPTAKRQRLTAPKDASMLSTPRRLLPDNEHISRHSSILSDYDPLLDDFHQRVPHTSVEVGAEPAAFDGRLRVRVPFLSRGLKYGADSPRNPGNSALAYRSRHPAAHSALALLIQEFAQPTVRFLTPNTVLNSESEVLDPVFTPLQSRQSSVSTDSEYVSVEPTGDLSDFTDSNDEPYSVRWQEPEVLTDLSGLWPSKRDEDLNTGSFTLKGWFPSAAFILKQLLPRDLDGILATKEARKVIAEKHPNPQWAAFLSDVEVVERWEQCKVKDLLGIGTVAPDYIFINLTINTLEYQYSSDPPHLQWLGENSFASETFPSHDFDTTQENEESVVPEQPNQRLREEKAWEPNQRAPIAQYMMTARRLTALPADVEGIENSLADHPDLKVEVAVDHQHSVRRRTREGAMSIGTEFRLMVAVVVIRTLTGGLDKQIDWVLVSKLFPDFPMNAVSKRWQVLYVKHEQMIERLGPDFQEFFLEAYERGEVSPIDYDHLLDYDWNGLVDLVLERIDINPSKATTHRLPASRGSLNQNFTINNADDNRAWRDDYFGLLPAVYKRMEHAASEQYTTAISQDPPPNLAIDKFTVAKSWARANTLTPARSYNKDFAARKLATIGNGIVAAATSALFESKVLMQRNKGRPTPNRGVEITDTFASALRKHLDETHLTQAAAFKASLDAKFRAGEIVMVEWTAKDGEILAITNLQAHGRVKLEPKGVPMNRFGLTGGGYQTKRMDKANLRFELQILPTASYIFDADLPILSALASKHSPPRGIAGAIPVWYDIGENLIPAMWKKVLCVVLATIAMRPGAVLKELVRIFTPALEEWEMRILIEWGLRVGALTVLREGYDGWNVAEWWWVIGGKA
jgi:hypothetical protein